jgi:hypothetical protein
MSTTTKFCRITQNSRRCSSPLQGRGFSGAQPPMPPSRKSPTSRLLDPGVMGITRVRVAPANPSCQSHISVVHYLLDTSLAASAPSPPPPFRTQKWPEIAEFLCHVSHLEATLMHLLASVANKRLTAWLSPLDATLTKNTGGSIGPVASTSESLKIDS